MATPYAVRRGGSLLLRALAVSGLAAAAWFVCAGVASAGEDHSDEAGKPLDAVNLALGGTPSAVVDQVVAAAVPEKFAPFASVTHEPQPFEVGQPFESFSAVELSAADAGVVDMGPLSVMSDPGEPGVHRYPDGSQAYSGTGEQSYSGYGYSDEYEGSSAYGSAGGYSGYSHSGAVSNTMPAPLYEAKVATKTAAREAAVRARTPAPAPPAPPAVTVTAPARVDVLPFAPVSSPVETTTQADAPNTEVVWEAPEPSAPAPAPKQAPAPSAPTASSGGADSGGGHRGGGVLVSLTGQSHLKPMAAWSAERWDDDRSPGSVPGLPSTSPD